MVNELKLETILELMPANQVVHIVTGEGTFAAKAKQLHENLFEKTREGASLEVMKLEAKGNALVIRT